MKGIKIGVVIIVAIVALIGSAKALQIAFEDIKKDPVANLLLPVVTSVLIYTALSLLWPTP